MKFESRLSHDDGDADDDRTELAALWEQARPAVFAYLTATVYDFHRAEDLLQEVAVAIAGKFHTFDHERSFLAWAIGIARNRVLLYFREQARDRRHFSDATFQLLAEAAQQYPPEEGSPKREALRHCLDKTTGRRRRVLDLRYTGGLSIAEIAARLDMTNSAVKIMLHRVRAAIEQCVERRIAQEGRWR
ncbi:MAG TPA: sigma-70 family RNA polymerase sigma factor [Lacipirellula sp.]